MANEITLEPFSVRTAKAKKVKKKSVMNNMEFNDAVSSYLKRIYSIKTEEQDGQA